MLLIRRIDRYEIPSDALREAILNAVVHRDYSMRGSDIKVAVFDSRIEITSPGGFPKGITVDEIIGGRSSNGTIFLLIPVIEEVGNTFRLSETLKEVQAQLVVLEQENTSLNEQKTKLLDPEYVKSYARANYMLTKEGEQIYYLPKDDEQDND